jgi:hypothetical protein
MQSDGLATLSINDLAFGDFNEPVSMTKITAICY